MILDLFCGAGGCSAGYAEAFPSARIVGIDISEQPNYPFEFIQADATTIPLDGFDLIHASPPCQGYTTMSAKYRGTGNVADSWPTLVGPMRDRLMASGAHWVLENVAGARKEMVDPVTLRGGMFGLGVDRPRLFESSFPISRLPVTKVIDPVGIYGDMNGRRLWTRKDGTVQRAARSLDQARSAMGIDWMTWSELCEAIPPAFTAHIGKCLAGYLRDSASA